MTDTVILDTNILQYGVSDTLSDEIVALLENVAKDKPILTISAFTKFEIYRGIAKSKIAITRVLVDKFTEPLDVDDYTCRIAAALMTCYKYHEATKGTSKWDDGDVIIAATAVRHNTPVLTANLNDFPRPFFSELNTFTVRSASNKAETIIQLLQPDIRVLNATMNDCLK